jgi:hypothetical protein
VTNPSAILPNVQKNIVPIGARLGSLYEGILADPEMDDEEFINWTSKFVEDYASVLSYSLGFEGKWKK